MKKIIKSFLSLIFVFLIILNCCLTSFGEFYYYVEFSDDFPEDIINSMQEQDFGIGEYFKLNKNELIAEDKISFHCSPGETIETNGESTYTFTYRRNYLGWRLNADENISTTSTDVYMKDEDGNDRAVLLNEIIPDEAEIKIVGSMPLKYNLHKILYSVWDDPATILIPDAVKEGYTLKGWSTEKDINKRYKPGEFFNGTIKYGVEYIPGDEITVINNIDLYPIWEKNEYNVVYNAEGISAGSVPVDNNNYSSESYTVTVMDGPGLEKDGCFFYGWNTMPDGSGCHFNPGDTFNAKVTNSGYFDTISDKNGVINLYAMWATINVSSSATGVVTVGSKIRYTVNVETQEQYNKISNSTYGGNDNSYMKLEGVLPDGVVPDTSSTYYKQITFGNSGGIYTASNFNSIANAATSSTKRYYSVIIDCKVNNTHSDGSAIDTGNILTANFTATLYSKNKNAAVSSAYALNTVTNTVGGYQVNYMRPEGTMGEDIADTNVYEENSTAVVTDKTMIKTGGRFLGWNDRKGSWGTTPSKYYVAGDELTMTQDYTLYPVFGVIKEDIKENVNAPKYPGGTFIVYAEVEFSEGMSNIGFSCILPPELTYVSVKTKTPANNSSTNKKHPYSLSYNNSTRTLSGTLSAPTVVDDTPTSNKLRHTLVAITVKVNDNVTPGTVVNVPVSATYTVKGNSYTVTDTKPFTVDKGLTYIDEKSGRNISYSYLLNEDAIIKDGLLDIGENLFLGWNTKSDGTGDWYHAGDTFEFDGMAELYAMYLKFEQKTAVTVPVNSRNSRQVIPEKEFTITLTVENPYLDGEMTVIDPIDPVFEIRSVTGDGEISQEDNVIKSIIDGEKGKEYQINITLTPKITRTYSCNENCGEEAHETRASDINEAVVKLQEKGCTCSKEDIELISEECIDAFGNSAYYKDSNIKFFNAPRMYYGETPGNLIGMAFEIVKFHTLSYDMNGADCEAPSSENFAVDSDNVAEMTVTSLSEFERTGYNFIGWSLIPDDTENIILPGASISDDEDVTLYALWEESDEPVIEDDGFELPEAGSVTLLLTVFLSMAAVGIYIILNKKFKNEETKGQV